MSNTIQIKRNSTANATPAAGNLTSGELAINTADGRLFAKNAAGTVVNLPVTSISGQAITPASVKTSTAKDAVMITAGDAGSGTLTVTLKPNTLNNNRTLYLPDDTGTLATTYDGRNIYQTSPANQLKQTIRNNFGDPTVEEAALFHGQFYNQLRFISPALQEESADAGVTWTTSTRATTAALGDMMRGEGEGTSVNILPSGSSTVLGYRLTWDNTVTGNVYWFFNHFYTYCSTNGNNVTFTIEAYHNTNGWTQIFSGAVGNYPGHVSIKHNGIGYYPTNANLYGKLRVTFLSTTLTTPVTLYNIEWFGGYPSGKRNAESYDRSKNVTFPAAINTPTGYRISNGATAGQYLRGNGTQFVSSGIQAGDVPTLNQSTTGSAGTLTTTRTLWGQNFNGSANVSGSITGAGNIEQAWSDSRVGTFFDNSYRMGFNYVTGSRLLNIFSTTADATGGAISFSTRLGAGANATDYGTERMRITNAGNVGIGNTAPGSRLVVTGAGATSATSALNVTNSADTSLLAVRNDGLATFTGQISSTLAVGTAPLAVTSTTVCTNLNADTVDGQHASAFAAAPSFTNTNASTGTLTAARNAFYRYTVVGSATITLPTTSQLNGDIVNILVGTYASGSLTISGAVTGNDVLSAAGQMVTYQYVSLVGWLKLPVNVHVHSGADITTGTVANARLPTANRLSSYCSGLFFG